MITGSRACACAYLPIHHHHDQAAASGSYRLCPANHENDGALYVGHAQRDPVALSSTRVVAPLLIDRAVLPGPVE